MTSPLYFEDLPVGWEVETPGVTLTEAQIIDFALTFDPQPFHLDKVAAGQSIFGELIASGFHTLALCFRLFYQTGLIAGTNLGGAGIDEVRWFVPVKPGDTLKVRVTVAAAEPSARAPDRGRVRMRYCGFNQHGEAVLTFTCLQIIRRRSG